MRDVSGGPLKLVIAGGGYAGLSALVAFRKQLSDAEITLIDPYSEHLIITRLHETVHRPLSHVKRSYQALAQRFGFTHIQQALSIDEGSLRQWQSERCIQLGNKKVVFDYLLIATGSFAKNPVSEPDIYDLNYLAGHGGADILEKVIADTGGVKSINIVGGGPSGLQFAFEIAYVLKACKSDCHLTVIDAEQTLLSAFPSPMRDYVEKRMIEKKISFLPGRFFLGRQDHNLLLEDRTSKQRQLHPSDLTLLLLGKRPDLLLYANSSGQVRLGRDVLENIFTAGDCSFYEFIGSNLMTAQVALRKGKAAAKNILRNSGRIGFCLPYLYQDLGYMLCLGPSDAVGWIGSRKNIITGWPAFAAKELAEFYYDLLLAGVDNYWF